MEEQQKPSSPSLGSSIVNVLTAPGEAFQNLAASPPKASIWVVPLIAAIALVVVFMFVIQSNETLKKQILDVQTRTMQQKVDKGKMTQAQADQATEAMERMGSMFLVFGIVGGSIFVALYFFCGTLFLWLAGKFALKAQGTYGKFLELYGLSSWVYILGSIITLMMILAFNSLYATPSAALALQSEFDPLNDTHKLLSSLNIFSIWQVVVLGLGLSKYSGKSAGVGIGTVTVLWLIWVAISVSLGIAR